MTVLFELMFNAAVFGTGFGTGAGFMYIRSRTRMPEHEHAWREWEDSLVTYPTGREVAAQRRWCITCNFKEVRLVIDE